MDTRRRVEGWPRTDWLWDRQKPLYIGEYLWQPGATPDPYTLFYGDDAYTDVNQYRILAKGTAWRYEIEAYRALGLSGGCPWNIFEGGRLPDSPMYQATRAAYRPQCVIVKEWSRVVFAGQPFTRTLYLINDILRPAELRATAVCLAGGQEVSRWENVYHLGPAQIEPATVTLNAPAATGRERFELVVCLHSGETEVFRETRSCWAMAPEPVSALARARIALYDPPGTTAALLATLGVPTRTLTDLTAVPAAATCLVVGEEALGPAPAAGAAEAVVGQADPWQAVGRFVDSGGAVLVLAQNSLPAQVPASLVRNGSTIAFLRRPAHPVVADTEADDFSLWPADHVVSRLDLARPDAGAARVIVDAGGDGLDRALLMEVPSGQGLYVFSQMLLVAKANQAPVARRTLVRLLDWAATQTPRQPKPVAVAGLDPTVTGALRSTGVVLADQGGDLTGLSVLLIDQDQAEMLTQAERLSTWVESGGVVWLHRPGPATLEAFGLLRGQEFAWETARVPALRVLPATGLGPGLRNEDLYWLSESRPRRYENWALAPDTAGQVLRPRFRAGQVTSIPLAEVDNSTVRITSRDDKGIWLATNGTVTARLHLSQAGRYVVGVRVGGKPLDGVYPAFTVAAGDLRLGGVAAVTDEPALQTVAGDLPAGDLELRVSFVNDASRPPTGDRNGLVAGIEYGPAPAWPRDLIPLTEPAALLLAVRGKGAFLVDGLNWQAATALNAAKVRRLLSTLLGNAGARFAPVSRGTAVSLAGFEVQPGAVHCRKDADGTVYLGNTAWTEGRVRFARSSRYTVTVEARGTEALGEFPEIELSVDGRPVGAQHLGGSGWQEPTFTIEAAAGEHTVRVRFTNDYYDAGKQLDRNLWLRRLRVAAEE